MGDLVPFKARTNSEVNLTPDLNHRNDVSSLTETQWKVKELVKWVFLLNSEKQKINGEYVHYPVHEFELYLSNNLPILLENEIKNLKLHIQKEYWIFLNVDFLNEKIKKSLINIWKSFSFLIRGTFDFCSIHWERFYYENEDLNYAIDVLVSDYLFSRLEEISVSYLIDTWKLSEDIFSDNSYIWDEGCDEENNWDIEIWDDLYEKTQVFIHESDLPAYDFKAFDKWITKIIDTILTQSVDEFNKKYPQFSARQKNEDKIKDFLEKEARAMAEISNMILASFEYLAKEIEDGVEISDEKVLIHIISAFYNQSDWIVTDLYNICTS